MDVDGTLTDGKIYMMNSGDEGKAFSVKDGLGIIELLPKKNIIPAIITGRESLIVKRRAEELGINEIYQNVKSKYDLLLRIMEKYDAERTEVAYIGDDINDLECMMHVGFAGCPCDAADEIKKISSYVCKSAGGSGAVREFIEFIIQM